MAEQSNCHGRRRAVAPICSLSPVRSFQAIVLFEHDLAGIFRGKHDWDSCLHQTCGVRRVLLLICRSLMAT
jgi:hypothetical protein